MAAVGAPSTLALVTPGPGWEITAQPDPTHLPPGGSGVIEIDVYNTGGAPSVAGATLTDTLPIGVEAVNQGGWSCTGGGPVACAESLPAIGPGEREKVVLDVSIEAGASGTLPNQVKVMGGGASASASAAEPITLSPTPAGFGVEGLDGWFTNADGSADTQAGSHPYEATFSLDFNNALSRAGEATVSGGEVKNVDALLPAGFVGDPNAVPQCTRQQFDKANGLCPPSTQVGVARIGFGGSFGSHLLFPVYNLVPPPDEPAQFGLDLLGVQSFFDATVRSDGDYGITVHISSIPYRGVRDATVTFWGVPADPSHDSQREGTPNCRTETGGCPSSAAPKPFLTLPTSCAGPLSYTLRASSWQNPGAVSEMSFVSHDSEGAPTEVTGCESLGFGPSISVAPDTGDADTPAGLTAEVRVPQEGLMDAGGVAASSIENTTVTLPEGVVINPGQAAGLQACQSYQDGVGTENPPACPLASKVGEDEIQTPLLRDPLRGNVYVLQSNPPNLQLLVVASGDGVEVKLVGDVHLDEATGRLTTTFRETPELPFTDFKLSFSGGAQAALATPTGCGTYTTNADFTPWATPFVPDFLESSSFAIDSGPLGSACASPLPFSPSLIAGSTTDQAGGYTDFSLLLQRGDGQQRISTLQFKTPEGLLGMISHVALCQEPQAAAGRCSADSQIGHTVVESGPGPYPLVVPEPGQPPAPIYLTGPYKGAPYGLSIAVPVIAGPFNLGTVVVRSSINVDPRTAQLTITTDPLPSILDGVPTDLRTIDAIVDRPSFMFNPTDCTPAAFSGTATSTEGASAPISSRFQVGSCQSLKFRPAFLVSTSGRTSKKDGASLDVRVLYPPAPVGRNQASSQANIAMVKVKLPKRLPSRLATLQKACVAAVFEANPANCPRASVVGHATAVTPVLAAPLTGPAYFVSHGNEAFPSLIIVLQGQGFTVDLVGATFISKAGVTTSTFKSVPDVPVTAFELKLPAGPNSALAAPSGLCKGALDLPTELVSHSGQVIVEDTRISVHNCSRHRHRHRPSPPRRRKSSRASAS